MQSSGVGHTGADDVVLVAVGVALDSGVADPLSTGAGVGEVCATVAARLQPAPAASTPAMAIGVMSWMGRMGHTLTWRSRSHPVRYTSQVERE